MLQQETLTSKYVNTRKPHRCIGCYKVFFSGSFMYYWAGKVEGDFHSNYWCPSCTMFINSDLTDGDFYPGEIETEKREVAPEMFEAIER